MVSAMSWQGRRGGDAFHQLDGRLDVANGYLQVRRKPRFG
jgi:hypothetical protein